MQVLALALIHGQLVAGGAFRQVDDEVHHSCFTG